MHVLKMGSFLSLPCLFGGQVVSFLLPLLECECDDWNLCSQHETWGSLLRILEQKGMKEQGPCKFNIYVLALGCLLLSFGTEQVGKLYLTQSMAPWFFSAASKGSPLQHGHCEHRSSMSQVF